MPVTDWTRAGAALKAAGSAYRLNLLSLAAEGTTSAEVAARTGGTRSYASCELNALSAVGLLSAERLGHPAGNRYTLTATGRLVLDAALLLSPAKSPALAG